MPDVNMLIAAHLPSHPHHSAAKDWLEDQTSGLAAFGLSDVVLSGFVRIMTNKGAFRAAVPVEDALDACNVIRRSPRCMLIRPGSAHWMLFEQLCRGAQASGKLVPDAWFAALAIENGCTWVTTDGDYARFAGLTWRHFPDPAVRTNPP
jgi:toxin-antitoxin system PIN domain toxin